MKASKQIKSKYNFGNLKEVGQTMYVNPEDVFSALQSLNSFNRRHGTKIALDPDFNVKNEEGQVELTVLSL